MAEGWRFRLLGPLEVRHDGRAVPVAAPKQRVLIALLALAAGDPVPVDRLIAGLWDEQPPASARNTLQNYVLRLRRILTAGDEPSPLVTSSAGYRLAVDADAVDVHRFGALLRRARDAESAGEPRFAASLLEEASGLWHGEALTDAPSDLLRREVLPGLVERRLAAQERRVELELGLGHHHELVTELVALTAAHPLRERLWAQLMLALYRSGRTGEALETYRKARAALAEQLGIDPGPELRRLHQEILAGDPGPAEAEPESAAVDPDRVAAPAPPRVVPRQLPASVATFIGRGSELAQLTARLAGADTSPAPVCAISGTAGIGKTALAVYWGHVNAARFPDGQLYVNLRGFDPVGVPMSATAAVHALLTGLGVKAQEIPADQDEQFALYRSLLADRRILVVLDNARDAEQVRPLLPAAPGCMLLVTSRDQLAGLVALDGAVPVPLDLPDQCEARDLLISRLSRNRVEAEPEAARELIERCARLPLAITIAAAHAAVRPGHPLEAVVEELRDAQGRLETLSAGAANADVRAVFSWSYDTLTPESARVFRMLGLQPGPDIGVPATAGLSDLDPADARRALAELTRTNLVTERAPGRYSMHDLLRAYAFDQAQVHDGDTERRAARKRLCEFYVHTADRADALLADDPSRDPIVGPVRGARPLRLTDVPAAMTWFDAEHTNLMVLQQTGAGLGLYPHAWHLARALATFHDRRGHRHDALTVRQIGLEAAVHLTDPNAQIHAHRLVGAAYADLDRYEEGVAHLDQALESAEKNQDLDQQAKAHQELARVRTRQGDDWQALKHVTLARDLFRSAGRPRSEATSLNDMGRSACRLGDYDTANDLCHQALATHRSIGYREGEAAALDTLGYIAHRTGHHHNAITCYRRALTIRRMLYDTSHSANTVEALGHPHAALGEHQQAHALWRKALELYRQQGRDHDADRVRQLLDARDGTAGF
ncbi:DNA-binding SARP family transcriptional activator/Tfp pilus assembly protein PilF [Catenulispora sp. EB89]|uniref:AfsR/SARP family transcriptional regulator n=1 Tax=Catenulispora sp. EB89 TaxID=3156257 RepID=UPI003512AD39